MSQRLQCPWGKTPASQDDIFPYSGGMPCGWSPSSLDRNRMAHATNGNGTGGARKGSGNVKKGAKSVYTAPSPAPIPLPDGGLLQSWGSAPADVDETQLLRDIHDAMPLEAKLRKMPKLVPEEWNAPTLLYTQLSAKGGVSLFPKEAIPSVMRSVGFTAAATAMLITAIPSTLGLGSYPHSQVECTIVLNDTSEEKEVRVSRWCVQLGFTAHVFRVAEGNWKSLVGHQNAVLVTSLGFWKNMASLWLALAKFKFEVTFPTLSWLTPTWPRASCSFQVWMGPSSRSMLTVKLILQWWTRSWYGCLTTPPWRQDVNCLMDFRISDWFARGGQHHIASQPSLLVRRMPRRFARSTALSSRLMVAGSSMVCRWPTALQVRSSFSKIKAGIPMWLNILMPRVSVFSQIRWDRILLCNFTLQTVMPCRSSSRRSTVQLEPCPNGLQHSRLPKQVPHCQAKLVSLASSRKISWSQSHRKTSVQVRRPAPRRRRKDRRLSKSEGPFWLQTSGFTSPTLVKRGWASVCCAQRSQQMRALHGNGTDSIPTCWLGSFNADGLTKSGRWNTLLSYEYDILCLQETHLSASKQQVLTSSTSLHCLWGAPILGTSRCGVGIIVNPIKICKHHSHCLASGSLLFSILERCAFTSHFGAST